MNRVVDMAARLVALGLLAAWCFTLLLPFVATILWGGALAVALLPVFTAVSSALGAAGVSPRRR